MKKLVQSGASIAMLFSASIFANAQVAKELKFPNPQGLQMFGFSVNEFNGNSIIGTEFADGINVFQGGVFKYQVLGPLGSRFGHSVGLNSGWTAAGAHLLFPEERGAVYLAQHLNGQPQRNFNVKINSLANAAFDHFGKSLDLFNDWMVVGAPNVNRPEHGGYAEVWKHTNGTWARRTVVRPANLPLNADFGFSVAIRNDRMVVGAPGISKIFIYKLINNVWTLEQQYQPDKFTWAKVADFGSYKEYYWNFGYDLDITDGHIIIGDPTARKAGIIAFQNNFWTLIRTFTPPATALNSGDMFGVSVAIRYNRAAVGAPRPAGSGNNNGQGKVYMYTDGYQFKGTMYVGNPSHLEVLALGYDISIESDNVLAGASNTHNFSSVRVEGAAFRMPFYFVTQSGNWRLENGTDAEDKSQSSLFPNPATGNEVMYNAGENLLGVEAISAAGETISLHHVGNQIKVGDLNPGMYFLKISTESGFKNVKFIKE